MTAFSSFGTVVGQATISESINRGSFESEIVNKLIKFYIGTDFKVCKYNIIYTELR